MVTPAKFVFLKNALKSCVVTSRRFTKIKILPPSTAALFGVIPHVEILNRIAESAMPFTTMVTADNRHRIKISDRLLFAFAVSATEKNMIAITPMSNALKMSKNSRSL